MVDPHAVRAAAHAYLDAHGAAQLEAVLALFAPTAVLQDPVGTPPRSDPSAIREFYAATHARQGGLHLDLVGPVIVCGNEASLHVRARRVDAPSSEASTDVIYTLAVDEDGAITSLRAWFER